MAKDKQSFLLYCDLIKVVEKLPEKKAGQLFLHILRYVNDLNPETDDLMINIAFEPVKLQLKRDLKKYESICDRNKNNGLKGGRPEKENPKEPKKPSGLFGNPKEPKKADTDTDTDTDIKKEHTQQNFSDSQIRSIYKFAENEMLQLEIELKNSRAQIEQISKNLNIDFNIQKNVDEVKNYIPEFIRNIIAKGKAPITLSDARAYFASWLVSKLSSAKHKRFDNGDGEAESTTARTLREMEELTMQRVNKSRAEELQNQ